MILLQALLMIALGMAISEMYNWRIRSAEHRANARDDRAKPHQATKYERRGAVTDSHRKIAAPPLPMSANEEPAPVPDWFAEDLKTKGTAKARRVGQNWERH